MNFILTFLELLELSWEVLEIGAMIVLGSTGISALLPNSSKNKFVQFLLDTLNVLAGNVHRNRNECDKTFTAKEFSKWHARKDRELGASSR